VKQVLCLAGFVCAAAVLVWAPTAAAGDVTCTGGPASPLTGKIVGNVVVPAGASCRIQGTVTGNVTALSGAAVGIRVGSIVRGNYTCDSCLFADLHGSTVFGNVVISGETDGSFIDGSTIKGNLEIDSSDADGDAFSIGTADLPNTIGGNLLFTKNTGQSSIIIRPTRDGARHGRRHGLARTRRHLRAYALKVRADAEDRTGGPHRFAETATITHPASLNHAVLAWRLGGEWAGQGSNLQPWD
jgi:hypothetical protein